ncbi:DNA repair protein RecO [Corynebacterium freiburgense]|uniref:DNA repair protein RecO n=1 Tax=Corynebacterium freiburgense TaxID=556548 RepID=UPI00041B1601|nr:DNA repair protein RecO [Corynebacterium freiburgense]WJZ03302.1 DNA repair protein RecO [Corynebacterium freiburgense]
MGRESYRERALVVRTYDFGEADRIIVLLTRTRGVVRGVAKGVRRSKSRFGSRLQPFVELNVQVYPGRKLSMITSADTLNFYASGIIDDYERYTAACAVLEAAERLAIAEFEDPWLYDAALGTLVQLCGVDNATFVLDSFLLRAMDHAGWAPSLFECAQCRTPGPHSAFHPGAGGAVCRKCQPKGSAEIPEETLRLMWWLANNAWDTVRGASISNYVGASAHRLTRAHLQWHLERAIVALDVHDQGAFT